MTYTEKTVPASRPSRTRIDPRQVLVGWHADLRSLRAKHTNYPAVRSDPLYVLPAALQDAIRQEVPGWFSPEDVTFESDFRELCRRHQAAGVFCGQPVPVSAVARPPAPLLSEPLFRRLGWDKFWRLDQAQRLVDSACGRVDQLADRLDAYRGWLTTNPRFQQELADLRRRWAAVVSRMGRIPVYPVQASGRPQCRAARDVTASFAQDFNAFFDRWELRGMATWDLPLPRGANLSGLPAPASVASPATTISMDASPVVALPGNLPLRQMFQEAQHAELQPHLDEWWEVVRQQQDNDLGFTRFQRMFQIGFYRDAVLYGRYADRFLGHVEALDRAFGRFLDVGDDSIKKTRLQMMALRRRH